MFLIGAFYNKCMCPVFNPIGFGKLFIFKTTFLVLEDF